MPLTYASVCSGIETAHLALTPLSVEAQWFSDIDPFARAHLTHHYPHISNHGDMRTLPERIRNGEIEAPDLLCAGTPCQSFSSIGQRASLADTRGNLIQLLNACDHHMHPHSIQIGKIYINNGKGRTRRKVLAIGLEHRPDDKNRYWGVSLDQGVLYEQYSGKSALRTPIRETIYLSSFAKWAGREA